MQRRIRFPKFFTTETQRHRDTEKIFNCFVVLLIFLCVSVSLCLCGEGLWALVAVRSRSERGFY
jgi:hypothetical protein